MPHVTVLTFDTPDAASEMLRVLHRWHAEGLIAVRDAVAVCWRQGQSQPMTHAANLAVPGAMNGMLSGMLLGSVFHAPWFGMAVGAAIGAIRGTCRATGVGTRLIAEIRGRVREGTSALIVMTEEHALDRAPHATTIMKFEASHHGVL